jgi:hypothetical protein
MPEARKVDRLVKLAAVPRRYTENARLTFGKLSDAEIDALLRQLEHDEVYLAKWRAERGPAVPSSVPETTRAKEKPAAQVQSPPTARGDFVGAFNRPNEPPRWAPAMSAVNVLVAIFALLIVALLGFSFMGAPQYQAGDPRSAEFGIQKAAPYR